MPSHVGPSGVSSTSKMNFILFYSGIAIILYFLMKRGESFLFKKSSAEASVRKYFNLRLLISLAMAFITLYIMNINEAPFSTWGFANLFIVGVTLICCNYFPIMTQPNYLIGIRFPWTVSSEYVWLKTHQHIGKIWFVVSLMSMVTIIFLPEIYHKTFFMVFIGSLLLHSAIYSGVIAIREQVEKRRAH